MNRERIRVEEIILVTFCRIGGDTSNDLELVGKTKNEILFCK